MMKVFLLQHMKDKEDYESLKMIGVYSSEEAAIGAKKRLVQKPGFQDYPEGFHIGPCIVDQDYWGEGFTSWAEAAESGDDEAVT